MIELEKTRGTKLRTDNLKQLQPCLHENCRAGFGVWFERSVDDGR